MADAVVRTRRIGARKNDAKRLPFVCRNCGGRWKLKADADGCCDSRLRCNRNTDCPARSHYGDCRSMSPGKAVAPVSALTKDCKCQGGWICPTCADVLRSGETTATARSDLARKVIETVESQELKAVSHQRCAWGNEMRQQISDALRTLFQEQGIELEGGTS